MNKHIFVIAALLTLSASSQAKVIPANVALQRATTTARPQQIKGLAASHPTLIYTGSQDGLPAYYIFQQPSQTGFVILSADDQIEPVIAYSNSGTAADINDMPQGLKDYLADVRLYVSQVRSEETGDQQYYVPTNRKAIEPLLSTQWHQHSPFNDMSPKLNSERCVAGCVPVAMAQVMKYHRHPLQGTGSKGYSWPSYIWEYFSTNFTQYQFDWDNMLDVYTDDATDVQKQAVATLAYCCGMSVETDWSVTNSTAYPEVVPNALINYFGYSRNMAYVSRMYYNTQEWEELMYNQLSASLPVIVSAKEPAGGHEFVCDGYDGNGLFHINWGWGGSWDGYYTLMSLYPRRPEVDASSEGFAREQYILTNVYKADNSLPAASVICCNGFNVANGEYSLGTTISVSGKMMECTWA